MTNKIIFSEETLEMYLGFSPDFWLKLMSPVLQLNGQVFTDLLRIALNIRFMDTLLKENKR